MAKLEGIKRLVKEDFSQDDQDLIDRLGYVINPAFESISRILNKGIDVTSNLNQQIIDFSLRVDATGSLITDKFVRFSLANNQCRGVQVIAAVNLDNPAVYPTTQPFVSFRITQTAGVLSIENVTGIQANTRYRLTLLLIGS